MKTSSILKAGLLAVLCCAGWIAVIILVPLSLVVLLFHFEAVGILIWGGSIIAILTFISIFREIYANMELEEYRKNVMEESNED